MQNSHFCIDLCILFGFSSSGHSWGNGGTIAKWPADHSLSKGSCGPGGRPGHRLGRAGHPVLQFSPSYQISGQAPHCLVIPKIQNKELLLAQERVCSCHLSPLPYPACKGPPWCLSFSFQWETNFSGQMCHRCGRQVRSLRGHFSTLSSHAPPGGDAKVQSTMNINMNKKMNLKMTGY